jgi:hypothetical protein
LQAISGQLSGKLVTWATYKDFVPGRADSLRPGLFDKLPAESVAQWTLTKKAFAAIRVNLRYGMTQDAFQVQERFSRRDPAFTPWQPNGSGNGRILEMMLRALYFEHDGLVALLGGVPWAWLRENQVTRRDGLYTPRGRLDLEATMVDAQQCRLTLRAAKPGVLPARLRMPEHFEIC